MQLRFLLSSTLLACLTTVSASSTAFGRGLVDSVVFGVPRGGGLFGGNKNKEDVVAKATEAAAA